MWINTNQQQRSIKAGVKAKYLCYVCYADYVRGALTILLSEHNSVFYYHRRDWQQMKVTDYSSLRSIILSKKKLTKAEDFFVIIKPGKDATYKNAIDVLDEMSINDVQRYAFSEAVSGEIIQIEEMKN